MIQKLILICFLASSTICYATEKITIKGSIKRLSQSTKIILGGNFNTQTITINADGSFEHSFEIDIEQPGYLKTDSGALNFPLWFANGEYVMELEEYMTSYSKKPAVKIVSLKANQNAMFQYGHDTTIIMKRILPNVLKNIRIKHIDSVFLINPSSAYLPVVLKMAQKQLGDSLTLAYLNKFEGSKEGQYQEAILKEAARNSLSKNNEKLASFILKTPKGKQMAITDIKDKKYILVDFWSANCPPCRKNHIELVKIYNEYKDKGFEIVSVSLDKDKKLWKRSIKQDNMTWLNLSDLKGYDSEFIKNYQISAIPFSFLLDKDFKTVAMDVENFELIAKLKKIE